jgi:hypothetical protein
MKVKPESLLIMRRQFYLLGGEPPTRRFTLITTSARPLAMQHCTHHPDQGRLPCCIRIFPLALKSLGHGICKFANILAHHHFARSGQLPSEFKLVIVNMLPKMGTPGHDHWHFACPHGVNYRSRACMQDQQLSLGNLPLECLHFHKGDSVTTRATNKILRRPINKNRLRQLMDQFAHRIKQPMERLCRIANRNERAQSSGPP